MKMETVWTSNDSALLDDLLTFLEEPAKATRVVACDATSMDSRSDCGNRSSCSSSSYSYSPRPPGSLELLTIQQPQSSTNSSTTSVRSIKRTLDQFRSEAQLLTEQLQRLRQGDYDNSSTAMESAQNERFKRRRAERECQQLRDAVYAQTLFIRGLKSVFSMPPSFAAGLNLCHHLHNYTRLPRDRSTRWNEYATLAQETRLKNAMDILCRETESLSVSDDYEANPPTVESPVIRTELITDRDGFGVTTTSVYALETTDLSAVSRGACIAVRDIVAKCASYQCTSLKRHIVDPEASSFGSNILYRVLGVHHKSLRDSDELEIESRIVTLYKQTEDYAVVLWDYVDDDELHPEHEGTDITRQAVGACLIRRELCSDGVERTMYRAISTRRYRFHENAPADPLRRFQQLTVTTMKANELIFRGIMMDSITKEEAAYAQAVGRLNAV